MEIRQLRYFVAVAEEMHFNRAAARLLIAQPALSQQIQRLERELKTRLFTRTTRSVELTETGKVLLVAARKVILESEQALRGIEQAVEGRTGLLRVGFVGSAALNLIPRIVPPLRIQYPGLELELHELTTEQQLGALESGTLDVGIVRDVESLPGITARELTREPLIVALPDDHPLARRPSLALADLSEAGFVVFPRDQVSRLYDVISALCLHAGFRLRVAQEAIQFPTILGLVAAKTGIAVVPEGMRALQLAGLRYVPLTDTTATSTVSLIVKTDRAETPLIARFTAAATGFASTEATVG
ncbi:LysR family transcriptional regulator [Arthrobacter sp. AOP36-A1-22]|uniref:LysR family transcriptional regulator n=1 Tax=unclassified Arthrobacter TaxID=235627 RepID=UPI0040334577